MKNNLLHTLKYIGLDILSASLAWLLFMCYRVVYLDKLVIEFRLDYAINLLIISICWIVFYAVVGNYNDIYRKSRLKEITQIFLVTLIGVTIIRYWGYKGCPWTAPTW